MIDVVIVSVADIKEVFYVSPNLISLNVGDYVIFESELGLLVGSVIKASYKEKRNNLVLPLYNVLRIVNDKDIKIINKNKEIMKKSLKDAKKISSEYGLDMKFIDSYLTFDNKLLIFSFVSDERIDFRDLVKKLAQKYKKRIELRQIGVRDKAKKIGGLGPCGLFLCCNSFLTDFNSVSINMAKNQMLALNPSKINGMCGRLLCCLGYENETYTILKKSLPKVGSSVKTPDGIGKVVSIDVFANTYSIDLGDNMVVTLSGEKRDD